MNAMLLLCALAASPVDVKGLVYEHRWPELEKALKRGKLPAAQTPEEVESYTYTQVLACEAKQDAIAEGFGKLGGKAGLLCLAEKGKWDEVKAQLASLGKLPDDQAKLLRLPIVAARAVKANQLPMAQDIITRITPTACDSSFGQAFNDKQQAAMASLVKLCPSLSQSGSWLLVSCSSRSLETVRSLVELGFDPKASSNGTTCLHWAALRGEPGLTKFLLEHGADVAAVSESKQSVLSAAVAGSSPEVVQLILAKGADPKPVQEQSTKQLLFPEANKPNTYQFTANPEFERGGDAERQKRLQRIQVLLHGEQRAVLIIGGGADAAELQQAQAAWQAVAPLADKALAVAPGFPRVAKSDDIPGLKPGFQVLLLAAAEQALLDPLLPLVQAIRPGSYLRQVTWTPETGPAPLALKLPASDLVVTRRTLKGKSQLSVAAIWRGTQLTALVTLFDAKGQHLAHEIAEKTFGMSCGSAEIQPEEWRTGFRFAGECDTLGCTEPNREALELRIAVKGQEIETSDHDQLLHKGQCD